MTWGICHVPAEKRFIVRDAMEKFREKCEFDPKTGCVLWIGAKCWGRGKSIRYGSFRDGKKTVLAHRWAAQHIHGFDIEGLQVDHCCDLWRAGTEPLLPNTLCVQHVQPLSSERNRHLQTERRRHYIELEVGLRDYYEIYGDLGMDAPPEAIPFYEEPSWLKRKPL